MNSENTRGREKCERIIIKGEPQANTIQVWITDVPMQARSAYGFDPDHVSDVLEHPESRLDTKIVYSHLENALFQGLMGCITTPALTSDVRVRMMQRNQPLCALRLMKIIIGYFRVSEENEETLYANSLAATKLIMTPSIEEEQSLDEFFSRWEMQFVNYMALETRSMTDIAIANQLFLTVKNVKVLAHDVEAWRNLPTGSRTTTWLRDKIRNRISIWRSEKNCTIAASAALEVSAGPGYSAMPAESRGGAYRTTPNRANQVGGRGARSRSPSVGKGTSIPSDVRKLIGTQDDPKVRFGSKSLMGRRSICYPYTRGKCPKTAEECEYSHDIFLWDEAVKLVESKGVCGQMFRYGKCRDYEAGKKCNFIHAEKPPDSIYAEFRRIDVPQSEEGQRAHILRRETRVLRRGEPPPSGVQRREQ